MVADSYYPDYRSGGYGSGINLGNMDEVTIWLIISGIIAIIGAILIYFIFLRKGNENRFKGFGKWLYECLNFRKLFLEGFLKFIYLISTIFITFSSFYLIKENFLGFLLLLTLGNLSLRIAYEIIMMFLIICRNTNDISSKLISHDDPYIDDKKEEKNSF